jgi:hypothetical protein
MEMIIDWPATKTRFEEQHKQKGIARSIGVDKVIFCRILSGTYPHMTSERAKAVVAKLVDMGVVVYKQPQPEEQAA